MHGSHKARSPCCILIAGTTLRLKLGDGKMDSNYRVNTCCSQKRWSKATSSQEWQYWEHALPDLRGKTNDPGSPFRWWECSVQRLDTRGVGGRRKLQVLRWWPNWKFLSLYLSKTAPTKATHSRTGLRRQLIVATAAVLSSSAPSAR